jgi:hypothetical protein
MYYVWQQDLTLDEDFGAFTNEPATYRSKTWTSAEKVVSPPAFDLIRDEDSPNQLSDLLLTCFPLQVFSTKLVSLLGKIGIDNIQYVPVKIVHPDTGASDTSYRIANVIGAIDCLDLENSVHARASGPGTIIRVSKFRLIPERIQPWTGEDRPPLLFRLGEFKRLVLAHESVKQACETEGITGVKFTPPDVYV